MIRNALWVTLLCASTHVLASSNEISLYSGDFDDYLMVAADRESGMLTGYYNDGKCRVYFRGPLQREELYQRSDFGEAYLPNVKNIGKKTEPSTAEVYSRARGGFQDQITIELHQDQAGSTCRSRITLDRANNVSNSFTAVAVLRKKRTPLYQIKKVDAETTTLIPDQQTKAPARFSGVWIAKTYSKSYSPAGYQYINWYDKANKVHAAYVRDTDLFPIE